MARAERRRRSYPALRAAVPALLVAMWLSALPVVPSNAAGTIEFGATPDGFDETRLDGLGELEGELGRSLDFVRVFELWDSPFPTEYHDELVTRDQRMLLSVRAKREDGSFVPWRDIADAQPGMPVYDELIGWVQKVDALGVPVWFTFNHEPETAENTANGVDQDFVDAWRRVVAEFEAQGVTNAEFVWIMTDYSFEVGPADRRHAQLWYPGDDVVDYIGADAYNYSTCRPLEPVAWRTLQDTIGGLRQFGASHPDKGLVVAEWASTEIPGDDGSAKAAWISDAQLLFKSPGWEQFVAVSYFDRIHPGHPECAWPVDSSPTALAALGAMASDAFFGGDIEVNNPPSLSILTPADGASVAGTVTVAASTDDPDGIAHVEFSINDVSLGIDTDGSDGWSTDWDTTPRPEGQATIRVTATDTLDAASSFTIDVIVDNIAPATVALVVADPASLSSGDTAVLSRLENNGYLVTVVDDNEATAATASVADLVIISSSTNSSLVGSTFKGVTTPVWISKPWVLDDNALTGPSAGTDYGTTDTDQVTITEPGHPLTAGIDGAVKITATSRLTQFGLPAAEATTVATSNGTPTVFVYEVGTQLVDGTITPGCRIAFSLFQSQPTVFTADGWTLFDAATTYATTGCDGTSVNDPPSVAVVDPIDGASVAGTATITATADDTDGIANVEFFVNDVSIGVDTDGSDGWSTGWDTTAMPEGLVTIAVTATDSLGASTTVTIEAIIDNVAPATVVFVVGNPASLTGGDTAVLSRLETGGYLVTVVDDGDATASTADGVDLLLISSTANSNTLGTTFKTATTPVWVSKPWLLDDMAMTGATAGTDYGTTNTDQITITDSEHPLAAGYTGAATITNGAGAVQFGLPGAAATTVATGSGNPTIFVYETGAQLADGTTSMGCRIASSVVGSQPTRFTATGWALFDAAATYATTGCDPTPVNDPPSVAIVEPLDDASVAGTAAITATADDADGIAHVEFLVNGMSLGVDGDGTDGWSVDWDTTTTAEGQVTIDVVATDNLDASAGATINVIVDNIAPATVSFIVGNPGSLTGGDTAVVDRLETNGYVVNLVDDNDATATIGDTSDLIIVSSTVDSNTIGATFKTVAAPVWVSKPWLLDDQAMTGPVAGTDYGTTSTDQVVIAAPSHPLAAGYTGTITMTSGPNTTQFGVPGPAATTVATSNGNPTIFVYEPGAGLADGTVTPGCRIALSIFQTQPTIFTADGWALFDATATYATTGCAGL